MLLSAGCAIVDGFRGKKFTYEDAGKTQVITFQVPSKYADEKYLADSANGKEQFFYYDHGALFYIAHNPSWLTENAEFIQSRTASRRDSATIYMGVDSNGLHWKERRLDKVKYGYSYVPRELVDKFESAFQSLVIREKNARNP